MDIDLFASRLTAQLPHYFSWRPDPSALATDALLQDWEGLRAYVNSPWNLLGRALAKVQRERVKLVLLIAPVLSVASVSQHCLAAEQVLLLQFVADLSLCVTAGLTWLEYALWVLWSRS